MAAVVQVFLLLAQVFGLAAAPAALTGFFMRDGGHPPRGFARAFKRAYPAWLLTLATLTGLQWWVSSVPGRPFGEMSAVFMLGILACGGYGAVQFVRGGAPRI